MRSAGILCVFQAFQAAGLGQKIRRKPQTIGLVFPQKMKGGRGVDAAQSAWLAGQFLQQGQGG